MRKSESIKNLAAAFSSFQAEMRAVKRDSINPYFKSTYADLATLIDAIRDPLAKHKLAVAQFPLGDGGLDTILMHESGEWIEQDFTMKPVDQKPQSVGSAITYARRYALGAVLGIATEEDDDGNAASKGAGNVSDFEKLLKMVKTATPDELKELSAKLNKSDKYTAKQKAEFSTVASERLAAFEAA